MSIYIAVLYEDDIDFSTNTHVLVKQQHVSLCCCLRGCCSKISRHYNCLKRKHNDNNDYTMRYYWHDSVSHRGTGEGEGVGGAGRPCHHIRGINTNKINIIINNKLKNQTPAIYFGLNIGKKWDENNNARTRTHARSGVGGGRWKSKNSCELRIIKQAGLKKKRIA